MELTRSFENRTHNGVLPQLISDGNDDSMIYDMIYLTAIG